MLKSRKDDEKVFEIAKVTKRSQDVGGVDLECMKRHVVAYVVFIKVGFSSPLPTSAEYSKH